MRRNIITNNIWLKLASLVLAVVLWFFVILSGRSGIVLDIPVICVNIPPQLEVVELPKTVSVTIEGQDRILRNLKQSELRAVINLQEARAGKNFYSLTSENINVPATLEITNIDPQTLGIMLEKQFTKTVSIQPSIVGLPEHGFSISEISVQPGEVDLEGPQDVVSKIINVKTESIDISGLNRDLQYKAKLNLQNSNVRASVQKVDVFILVRKKIK